jgi:hypothetical protein
MECHVFSAIESMTMNLNPDMPISLHQIRAKAFISGGGGGSNYFELKK